MHLTVHNYSITYINCAINVFIYMSSCYCSFVCFLPENTNPSLKPRRSGMSTGSLMTWLLRPWNLKEALSGPARTMMEMCSLTLLRKVWDVPCATLEQAQQSLVILCHIFCNCQRGDLGSQNLLHISNLWLVMEISGRQRISNFIFTRKPIEYRLCSCNSLSDGSSYQYSNW